MIPKLIAASFIAATIIVSISIVFSEQQSTAENNFQFYEEKYDNVEWSNEVTKILLREGELGGEWKLLWSDASKEYSEGESPVMIKKTISGNDVYSTSYNYKHMTDGTYQILIWKGELVSEWNPSEAVENIFIQTDAKIEKTLSEPNLNSSCVVAYYDYYGEDSSIQSDLLFSECAKNDYRVRINLVEGDFNQDSIQNMILLSNTVTEKI